MTLNVNFNAMILKRKKNTLVYHVIEMAFFYNTVFKNSENKKDMI